MVGWYPQLCVTGVASEDTDGEVGYTGWVRFPQHSCMFSTMDRWVDGWVSVYTQVPWLH